MQDIKGTLVLQKSSYCVEKCSESRIFLNENNQSTSDLNVATGYFLKIPTFLKVTQPRLLILLISVLWCVFSADTSTYVTNMFLT